MFNGVECRTSLAIDVTMKNLLELQITKAIIKTQEDERFEIGSELHDNVCQILAAALMRLGMVNRYLKKEGSKYYLECKEYIHLSLNEIRNLSHRLAPAVFDQITLRESLNKLFNSLKLEEKYQIDLKIDESIAEYSIPVDIQLNLYRILQEILSNILKYAKASKIEIHFFINENRIGMKVADDGIGYDMNAVNSGIGSTNMKRRAALFAGKVAIHSSRGNGCVVEVEIPLTKTKELAEV
jgi:signal transduction histidine kinase